MQKHTKYPKT